MDRKRAPSSEDQRGDLFLKRLRTAEHRAVKYSKVVLRFGSKLEEYEFSLPLLPLVGHSVKLRRCIESSLDTDVKGSGAVSEDGRCSDAIVIDMPDFDCDVDILRMVEDMVEDICCGVMDDKDISTSNVVGLFKAAEFLEMEIVKCKLLSFLEKNAFVSWEKCLDMLATFDYNDLPRANAADPENVPVDRQEENTLFERCGKAFLRKIEKEPSNDSWTKSCNVECLVRVAKLLPPAAAKHIYDSCRAERFGLCLNWSNNRSLVTHISLHFKQNSTFTEELPCATGFYCTDHGLNISDCRSEVRWMEGLSNLLPDLSRRSLFVLHLAKMMRLGSEATASISFSYLSWGFLCALLVEATWLRSRVEEFRNGLDVEVGFLEKLVIQGLGQLNDKHPSFADVLKLVMKFTFSTLSSIVKHFRNIVSDKNIDRVAKAVDNCIRENLKTSSFTTQQALMIYGEFPNHARPSHVELYQTMKTTALSAEEAVELSKLLDYDKLPDIVTEKFFGELEFGWDIRLVKRFLVIQELKRLEKEKGDRELTKLQTELSLQTADQTTLRSEMSFQTAEVTKLRNELSLQTAELMKLRVEKERDEQIVKDEMKRVVEIRKAYKDAAQHDLKEEKEKTTCKICLENPRDALSLPCMHFLYCTSCLDNLHQRSRTCPACRAFTSGVLKCNLTI